MNLPERDFLKVSALIPLVNVDLFITNEYKEILLSWRDDAFCGTGWHIPGGIIRHGELIENRIKAVAVSEIGIELKANEKILKISEIFLNQEYRNHFISFLYHCPCQKNQIKIDSNKAKYHPGDLKWFSKYPQNLVYSQHVYKNFLETYFKEQNN